ncbi:MAG: response regulator [Gammaproteobacteria bacterium]
MNAPEKKILIVEDDRTTALIEKLYLEELGYQITKIVANGEQAIEMTGKLKPDLVLMDIKLGKGMDGIDAGEVINKEFGIPVVLVTAYTDEALLERVMLTKFAGYINKPIREKDLLATIEIALSKIKKLPNQQQKKTDIKIQDVLRRIYNLTPAEARLTVKLLEYPQLKIVAEMLNIKLSTVRTHLKRIYKKTNTNSLPILIHKIVFGPAGLVINK